MNQVDSTLPIVTIHRLFNLVLFACLGYAAADLIVIAFDALDKVGR